MVRRTSTTPVRMCLGCRQRSLVTELLRVVAIAGVVTPDPRRRQPGRGASIHPDLVCLDLAERRRAFSRALRESDALDTAPIRDYLASVQQ